MFSSMCGAGTASATPLACWGSYRSKGGASRSSWCSGASLGLDAGGVSREFFFKAISELLDPAKGVFRVVEGSTYYPNDDFVVKRALGGKEDRVLTFAGRLLGKALLEGHHVPAGWNAVLLKHLMALPVSLRDDLRLLDSEISRSLELIADMSGAQLTDLALTFSVARPTLNGFEDVSLRGDGGEEVTEGNVQEFARLRATADLGGQQAKSIGCLVRGFRDVVPEATLLLLESPEELREALAGVEALNVGEWRAATQPRGEFKDTPKHAVVEWFWSHVATLDASKKAELLKWATGSARCPLGGFAKLHGRDGVLRPFTLTSVELAQCAYPAHTCFNRIDLPLFANQRDLVAAFDVALDPRQAQVARSCRIVASTTPSTDACSNPEQRAGSRARGSKQGCGRASIRWSGRHCPTPPTP